MFDLETGRFVFKEGKEVYPGMKIEDFKKTKLYEENVPELFKKEENAIFYNLDIHEIDGFEVSITLHFSSNNDYLEGIYIQKENWRVSLFDYSKYKIGKDNNFEYEKSVLEYLYKFLENQSNVKDIRDHLNKYKEWGLIRSEFVPYKVKQPENIQLAIDYSTVNFTNPDMEVVKFISDLF